MEFTPETSEDEFAKFVSALSLNTDRRAELIDLLYEARPIYKERSTAAVVRMRGWILLCLAGVGLSDEGLVFVLEELDTARDAYLVAAAARALRSFRIRKTAFAPFVVNAIRNIRYHDEPVVLDRYGGYALSSNKPTAVGELLLTLQWLGPDAAAALPELESLRTDKNQPIKNLQTELERTVRAIGVSTTKSGSDCCCALLGQSSNATSLAQRFRRSMRGTKTIAFEDQDGEEITFAEFFCRCPSIVAFFYTRCDNPQKCSLTIAKLAQIQRLITARGLGPDIHVAAITYDAGFDIPARLRRYGESRGFGANRENRLLRTVRGFEQIRSHFQLGVNFIGSLVNRHRIELYILDGKGQIAWTFQRVHWKEEEVVDRVIALFRGQRQSPKASNDDGQRSTTGSMVSPALSTIAGFAFAFFPKCPVCWATYMSFFGLSWLHKIPYAPRLQLFFGLLMFVNIGAVWIRSQVTHQFAAVVLVVVGAIALILTRIAAYSVTPLALFGIVLTAAGSFLSVCSRPAKSLSYRIY